MTVYYNENDPKAAAWLRELMRAGEIPEGVVDERSIEDIAPADLTGFRQCHFFAGIGGWPLALRMAGWPDSRPVWTGSCPCQPFSAAGLGLGVHDPRHLWPHWRWLVDQCRPVTVFGEQVASPDGREWLAGVRVDLDLLGYAFGAADLCAAGVGAPHIRQRLYWVADANGRERQRVAASEERDYDRETPRRQQGDCKPEHGGESGGRRAEDGALQRSGQYAVESQNRILVDGTSDEGSGKGGLGDADDAGSQGRRVLSERTGECSPWASSLDNWLPCADGKARRIGPGIEPLAHGIPGRVGLLRGYGNAIVPQVAATFVEAVKESLTHRET